MNAKILALLYPCSRPSICVGRMIPETTPKNILLRNPSLRGAGDSRLPQRSNHTALMPGTSGS